MDGNEILIFVLTGAWYKDGVHGFGVLGISNEIRPLMEMIKEVEDSNAEKWIGKTSVVINEKGSRGRYKIEDMHGNFAEFRITVHKTGISESVTDKIVRERKKAYRIEDIKEYLKGMYEGGNIDPWKYEYMTRKPEVINEVAQILDKLEDCNTPFNTTMDISVGNVMKGIAFDDGKLEFLWKQFGDVLIDDDGCILDNFLGFGCGTHREEIWHWFDEKYSGGVHELIYGKGGDSTNG